MPPYVPRKRLRSSSPVASSNRKAPQRKAEAESSKAVTAPPRKPTLFDDLDATSSPRHNGRKIREIQDSEDDDSPLSSLSDVDFEDVPPPSKRQRATQQSAEDEDEEDEDEDIEFEDVDPIIPAVPQTFVPADLHGHISNDLELTLVRDTRISLTNDALLGKKGPSKLERQIRVSTHCVHVLLLMWHNALRNAWICDPTLQGIMLSHLPPRLWDEVDRWRRGSGLELHLGTTKKEPVVDAKGKGKKATPASANNAKARKGKGKEKERDTAETPSRDWGSAAQRLENGAIDRSQGDPIYRLMKALSAWWKQRFRTTAPGLRKQGYMSLERLDRLTKGFNESQKDDSKNTPERFGERIRNLDEFRVCAQECAGSRDVGEQLFTALLRGLGMGARMVASLQPLGFGWNKLEEADPEKEDTATRTWTGEAETKASTTKSSTPTMTKARSSAPSSRRTTAGTSKATSLNETADSDLELPDSDDESVINVSSSDEEPTSTSPNKLKAKTYDKDLPYPIYWTEVLSPVQNRYIPIEPLITSLVGTNSEITVQALEPRGAKADKAKQCVSYILGYSPDGTAKDVTVRYLKGKIYPGRTKGNRLPPEKIPVYNKHGKVKRYEMRDWFKDRVMRSYARGYHPKHPVTEIDNLEDGGDLKPAEIVRKEPKEGEETLQFYQSSKEFVLERHLKREEALLPGAQVVRYFNPKAKKGKAAGGEEGSAAGKGEPVYLRKDVVVVKSAETWHKQGRAPKEGEQPLKRVPYRAATTNRRREIAEAELATGGKVLQGLYSMEQTDWIIPDPIVDGIIPKNEYGNIDLFAEHMCPVGAVHVPYRGAVRVCKRLGVDFAEAVVDFEFGHRMAVPVIQGVVVAEEYYEQVMEELRKDEEERKRKEDEKKRAEVMKMWRKMLMGLRIVERLRGSYGDVPSQDQKTGSVEDTGGSGFLVEGDDDGGGGGFIPEGYELEEEEPEKKMEQTSGFFPTTVSSDEEEDGEDGGFTIENGEDHTTVGRTQLEEARPEPELETESESESEPAPMSRGKGKSTMSTRPTRQSAVAMKKKKKRNSTKAAFGGLRRTRKRVTSSSSDDEDEEDEVGDSEEEAEDDDDVYMESS
ncbi:Rad4 transglutaminase-like domain containing protein [Naviculisporaceae sp. PSN 640]